MTQLATAALIIVVATTAAGLIAFYRVLGLRPHTVLDALLDLAADKLTKFVQDVERVAKKMGDE